MFIPSGTSDLGQGQLHTPHLTLVAQAIFADDLEFGVAVPIVRYTSDMKQRTSCCSVA
jgi:hypothetical protein